MLNGENILSYSEELLHELWRDSHSEQIFFSTLASSQEFNSKEKYSDEETPTNLL